MSTQPDQYEPFPVNDLPEPLARFVKEGAAAIGCDESLVALPLLSGLAAAIGNTRRIEIKPGWHEPAILWTAVVVESGQQKSPAFDLALEPLKRRQKDAFDKHKAAMTEWQNQEEDYRGTEPVADRLMVSEPTVESLAPLLDAAPRGLLLARDELSGWFGNMDAYRGGQGGDVPAYLEMHRAGQIIVDRKGGDRKTIHVSRASLSITGTIQPGILRAVLGQKNKENGLAARFLFACPPKRLRVWNERQVSADTKWAVDRVFERLLVLGFDAGPKGESVPFDLPMSDGATKLFKDFYDENAKEQFHLAGPLAAAWSKLEGYAARFALVIHRVREAADDPALESPGVIDALSMGKGIELVHWFKGEARRIYSMLDATADEPGRELEAFIRSKGGSVSVREIQRAFFPAGTADEAEAAVRELVAARKAQWFNEGKSLRVRLLDIDNAPKNQPNGELLSMSAPLPLDGI